MLGVTASEFRIDDVDDDDDDDDDDVNTHVIELIPTPLHTNKINNQPVVIIDSFHC